ncbi:MAG: hypothetical protein JRI58_11535 [Deltaproteobacteria bacterium]|nr:hypothetical protein [Deltaproteobacteria bacterium]
MIRTDVPWAEVFEHPNYEGWSLAYAMGQSEEDLTSIGKNDQISSIRIHGPASVQLYKDKNFEKLLTEPVHNDMPRLPRGTNGKPSFIRVVPSEPVKEFKIEDYLSETQRTFTIHGKYSGVTAVQGDFRVSDPVYLEGCGATMASRAKGTRLKASAPSSKKAKRLPAGAKQLKVMGKKGTWAEVTPEKILKRVKALPSTATLKAIQPKRIKK